MERMLMADENPSPEFLTEEVLNLQKRIMNALNDINKRPPDYSYFFNYF